MGWNQTIFGVIVSTMLSTGLGLVTDLFGTQRILAETIPYLSAFLPHFGIGLISGAVVAVCFKLKTYINTRVETVIAELHSYVEARQVYKKWNEIVEHFADTDQFEKMVEEHYSPKMEYRFKTLRSKYSKWLTDNEFKGGPAFDWQSELRAYKYAEYLKTYGYILGRWRVWRDRRNESAE